MSFKSSFVKFWKGLENLFLSNHACLSCRREIPDGTEFSLCEKCASSIEKINGKLCKVCGEMIIEDNEICDRCKLVKYNFDKSHSFAVYDDVIAKIVKRFKYNGKKYYAKYIAELMFQNAKYFDDVDLIIFVPIGKKRKFERGFNQAEEMAIELGKLTGIEVIGALEKIGRERHQAGLSQKDRRKNLAGTFIFKTELKEQIKNKNILIIDDVFTTGATLSECAKVIKTGKPKKIYCYTFAKTFLNSTNNGQNQQNNRA